MTTKQEYIDALGQMEELYYNSDNCTLAMNLFKEDINLLTGLVNECFEENAETNYEHYNDGIIELCVDDLAISKGKVVECGVISCSECDFADKNGHCIGSHEIMNWLKQPYKKSPYKLSQFEYDLLSVHKDYKTYNNIANQIHLFKMREKGYFKDVDTNIPIREILDNCEVIKR